MEIHHSLFVADTHTHSSACGHAYSSIAENAYAASQKGLKYLAMTEHGPLITGAPDYYHFVNLQEIPHQLHGVIMLKGIEANVLDDKGALDLDQSILSTLDWVIVSMHVEVLKPQNKQYHSKAWLSIIENPYIHVLGHCGDERYPFDEKAVLRAAKKYGKIIEINTRSFRTRHGAKENCKRIAQKCMDEGVPVVVSSDAHFYTSIGRFDEAIAMLNEIAFPLELILNTNEEKFQKVIGDCKIRKE